MTGILPAAGGFCVISGSMPPGGRITPPCRSSLSLNGSADPPPDYGMTACALGDGTVPPWSPDMSGRVVRDQVVQIRRPWQTVTIPLDAAAYAKLRQGGSALVSFETEDDEVQALDVPLR